MKFEQDGEHNPAVDKAYHAVKFEQDGEHNPAVNKAYHANARNSSETAVFIGFGFYV